MADVGSGRCRIEIVPDECVQMLHVLILCSGPYFRAGEMNNRTGKFFRARIARGSDIKYDHEKIMLKVRLL